MPNVAILGLGEQCIHAGPRLRHREAAATLQGLVDRFQVFLLTLGGFRLAERANEKGDRLFTADVSDPPKREGTHQWNRTLAYERKSSAHVGRVRAVRSRTST